MSSQPPDLSVVIVTFNGRDKALATLRAGFARRGDVRCEWLVVDSGSTDGTPDAIEAEFPDVRVFRSTNRGFAAGNNVALAHAAGRYVLLLNPDVEIETGTLAELVAALDARPDVGVASVLQQSPDGSLQSSIRRFPTPARQVAEALGLNRLPPLRHLRELDLRFDTYAEERSVDWLVGAFLLVRREALDGVGPLDERFFLYAEETDWCLRFRRAGWDVRHLPAMAVTHYEGDGGRPDLAAQLSHSRRLYAYKHFGRSRGAVAHAAMVAGHCVRLATLAPASLLKPRLRRRVRAEARGLRVLCGGTPPFAAVPPAPAAPGAEAAVPAARS